jgi:predicted AlkP superfamily phosphohydrolase/phosphomutase
VDDPGADQPAWNVAATDVLRGLDKAIGLLCELAERRGAAVLTVSDHGFGPCEGRIHVNRILIDAGLARAESFPGRLKRRLGRFVELRKLGREKHGDPEARTSSFDSSVYAQYPLDWSRTLGFAPHQDTAAMIYLNSTDRRAGAPLSTASQIDDARNSIVMALAEARHPVTNRPLFPEVISVAAAYGVDPAAVDYPDLIAVPDDAHWVRTKLSPGKTWVDSDPSLPGTHRMEGIIALAGVGLPVGRHLRASLVDVAPSVLALQNLAAPPWMEGKALPGLQPGEVTRLDNGQNAYQGPHETSGFEYSRDEQALIEQRLADLGYLE